MRTQHGNPPLVANILVYPEHEAIRSEAKELAADLGVALYDLVWSAVDDYVTLHQHIATREIRVAVKSDEYTRTRRVTRRHKASKKFICNYMIRNTIECVNGAMWQFWDGNKPPLDTVLYACTAHLSAMLDPEIDRNIVQRIEY